MKKTFEQIAPIWNSRFNHRTWSRNKEWVAELLSAKLCVVGEAWGYRDKPQSEVPVHTVYDRCEKCINFASDFITSREPKIEEFTEHWNERHVK